MRPKSDPPVEKPEDGTWQEFLTEEPTPMPSPAPGAAATTATTAPPGSLEDTPSTGVKGTSPPGEGSKEWDSTPAPVVEEGAVLFGKYRLIRKLGQGGMGEVWLVHNSEMNGQSALKLLSPEVARNDRGWRRFKREAQLMRKLNHPNAVAVYDYKRTQSMGYIEMEYVRGRTLDEVLKDREGKPLTLAEIVPVLDQLCSVLNEAHNHVDEDTEKPKPIIHRDLKPSNLMLVDRRPAGQNLKVLDFGIAKMIDDDDSQDQQLTGPGEFLGTVSYCSPEQIKGGMHKADESPQEIDGRSDLYSVGVLLYQLLTGAVPFRGSKMAILAAHLTAVPVPPGKANPKAQIPPEIEQIVLQSLAKDPARRPRSARDLADRFRAAAAKARPGFPPAVKAIAGAAVLAGLVATLALLGPSFLKPRPDAEEPTIAKVKTGPRLGGGHGGGNNPPPLWQPEGYEAVDTHKVGLGPRNEPERLKRTVDQVEFYRFSEGIYLPVGYEPEDPLNQDLEGDWPRVIVRTRDKKNGVEPKEWVRFFRIPGKTYRCGDVRLPPVKDAEPVWVRVSSFYLQETEVTNRVIEEYLETYPEDKNRLKQWRESAKTIKKRAGEHAANGIGLVVAWKCARYLGGRLPSEYEWEREAKSGGDDSFWSWGREIPKGGKLFAALDLRIPFPQAVMKYENDKTDHNIYDMTGNLREWCLDPYKPRAERLSGHDDQAEPLLDQPSRSIPARPNAIDEAQSYVIRGGSFVRDPDSAMVFLRDHLRADDAEENLFDVGFRVVIDCPTQPPAVEPAH